jgi:hypothetical protein
MSPQISTPIFIVSTLLLVILWINVLNLERPNTSNYCFHQNFRIFSSKNPENGLKIQNKRLCNESAFSVKEIQAANSDVSSGCLYCDILMYLGNFYLKISGFAGPKNCSKRNLPRKTC